MVAMQVGDENVGDLTSFDFVAQQLYLRSFTAIDQVISSVVRDHLTGWMSIKCRYR
jgi:hypothetical protein